MKTRNTFVVKKFLKKLKKIKHDLVLFKIYLFLCKYNYIQGNLSCVTNELAII